MNRDAQGSGSFIPATLDQVRAMQGYEVTLSDQTRVHVWAISPTETLVVQERQGEPLSVATSKVAAIPLSERHKNLLGDIWAALVMGWRRERRQTP
jgi:hypothetical protein